MKGQGVGNRLGPSDMDSKTGTTFDEGIGHLALTGDHSPVNIANNRQRS